MTKKNIIVTLLVSSLAIVGVGCNSSHELLEPKSLAVINKKPVQPSVIEAPEQEPLLVENTQKSAVKPSKHLPTQKNFITSLNKFLNIKYANMLGVLPQVINNDLLYSFIDEWYGTRYRLGGTDEKGIDCSAFVQRLYSRVFKVDLLRTAAEQFNLCQSIWKKEELKEGDLVFFNIRTKRISHVGIYLMNDFFVHSSSSQGVMISKLTDAYWKKYYAGAGRVPKVGTTTSIVTN